MNKIRIMFSALVVFVIIMILFQVAMPSTTSKKLKLDLHIKQQQQKSNNNNNNNKHLNNINNSNSNGSNNSIQSIYNPEEFSGQLKEYLQTHNNSFLNRDFGIKKRPKKDFYDGLYTEFKTEAFYSKAHGITNMITGQLYRNYFVTIVTQTTVDRLYKVSMMAEKWKAPLSVSVFIKKPNQDLIELKKQLQLYPALEYYADIHLFFANNTRYPVNNLRNLAINNSRTDFVFIMDADFLPPLGLHDYILSQKQYFNINNNNINQFNLLSSNNNNNINNKNDDNNKILHNNQSFKKNINNNLIVHNSIDSNSNSNGNNINCNDEINNKISMNQNLKVAFVIPSFSSSEAPENLPDNKEEMIEMINNKKVTPSNINVCKKCHSPTDFPKWIESKNPYEIEYKWIFEPYLVFNRSEGLPFDERLKGYGFDKNSHAFSMAVEGYHFVVLPESFIIHVNHKSSSWEGPSLDEQQWDALRIVCDIIPSIKSKNNFNINEKLFEEPLEDECYSDNHW